MDSRTLQIILQLKDDATAGIKSFSNSLKENKETIAGVGVAAGAVFAGVTAEVMKSVDAANHSANVQAQLAAALKSTHGAAGLYIDDLNDQAKALEGMTTFDDEAVNSAQALLLTFTNIKGAVYQQALPAIVDMSQAMGQDLQSSVIQVGKALNDPIQGISALSRVGVTFSDSQKQVITDLVNTGQTAKAQTMIIAELNKEFGGSAAAAASTFGGKMKQLANQIDDMQEEIGGALIPYLSKFAAVIGPIVAKMTEWATQHPKLTAAILASIAGVAALTVAVSALALATIAFSAVAWPVIGIMALVVAALVAVGVAVYELYQHWDDIKEKTISVWNDIAAFFGQKWAEITGAFTAAWNGIKDFFSAIWTDIVDVAKFFMNLLVGAIVTDLDAIFPNWKQALDTVSALWTAFWTSIVTFLTQTVLPLFTAAMGAIQGVWTTAWTAVSTFFTKTWDAIRDAVVGAIDAIIDKIQSLIDKAAEIASKVIDPIKKASGAVGNAGSSLLSGASNAIASVVAKGSSVTHVNDAIITPGGQVIQTHPDDYIFATKTPGSMGGGGSPIYITGTFLSQDAARKVADMVASTINQQLRLRTI